MAVTGKHILSEMVYLERLGFLSFLKLISEDIKNIAEPSRTFVDCLRTF